MHCFFKQTYTEVPLLTRILPCDNVSFLKYLGEFLLEESAFLKIEGLSKHFEGVVALEDIDLDLKKGEVVSLIGPNGAGKTTFFNCITGMIAPSAGTIYFQKKPLTGLKPFQVTSRGVARTFQNIRLFSKMSVLENVLVGRYTQSVFPLRQTFVGALRQGKKFRAREAETRDAALELLEFVGLSCQIDRPAQHLAYGDQRRLEIARAMASDPGLLLLDEPAAGMNPRETHALMDLVGKIQARGITPFLIEHNMQLVMGISDQIVVLNHGVKIAQGSPEEIQKNATVISAYLGGG